MVEDRMSEPTVSDGAEQYLRAHGATRELRATIAKAGERFSSTIAYGIAAVEGVTGVPSPETRAELAQVLRALADAIEAGELPPFPDALIAEN